jgi:hypothetical protein
MLQFPGVLLSRKCTTYICIADMRLTWAQDAICFSFFTLYNYKGTNCFCNNMCLVNLIISSVFHQDKSKMK